MVLVPGSGFLGNLAVGLALLLLVVMLARSFWRTARQPDDRDDRDDRPPR